MIKCLSITYCIDWHYLWSDKMINCIKDQQKVFENNLRDTLRSHNWQFTDKVEFNELYVYYVKDNNFMECIQLSCGWNWPSVKKVN